MDVSKNSGTPQSSIWIGLSITNHPFWGTPIVGNTHIRVPLWDPWPWVIYTKINTGYLCLFSFIGSLCWKIEQLLIRVRSPAIQQHGVFANLGWFTFSASQRESLSICRYITPRHSIAQHVSPSTAHGEGPMASSNILVRWCLLFTSGVWFTSEPRGSVSWVNRGKQRKQQMHWRDTFDPFHLTTKKEMSEHFLQMHT